jgi:predicted NUDIX family phosphoesterase/dephospho-CoA kinase
MGRFLDAAEIVLRREKRPMRAREITDSAVDLGLLNFSDGKTPFQTLKARICDDIRAKAGFSRFKRVDRGLFGLREFGGAEVKTAPFVKTIKASEDVLVFPMSLLGKIGYFDGINRNYRRYEKVLLNPDKTKFLPRIAAETDKEFKQVLSYVMIKYGDSVLRFTRGSYTSVRDYLKGRYCIGFGGHVRGSDFNLLSLKDSGYANSIYRELNEELRLSPGAINANSIRTIGVLNDDSSDLGKVHLAFIHLLELDETTVGTDAKDLKRERSVNQLRFVPIAELGKEFERYEYWSKLCIKAYFRKQAVIRPKICRVKNYSLRKKSQNIAIAGRIGSGKTEAATLLEERFDYSLISTGKVIQDLIHCASIASIGRKAFQDVAFSFIRSSDGPRRLADAIYNRINEDNSRRHVIDGIRNLSTFQLLKERLKGDISLIYVESGIDDSFEFYRQREEKNVDTRQFYAYVQHPVESEIVRLIEEANVIIYNQGNRTQYLNTVKTYLGSELL